MIKREFTHNAIKIVFAQILWVLLCPICTFSLVNHMLKPLDSEFSSRAFGFTFLILFLLLHFQVVFSVFVFVRFSEISCFVLMFLFNLALFSHYGLLFLLSGGIFMFNASGL